MARRRPQILLLAIVSLAPSVAGCLPSKDPYVYNFQTVTGRFPSESPRVFNVHTVVPGLLIRGGQPDEQGLRELRDRFGVRTVVNFNDVTNDSEAKTAAKVGLDYLRLRDNPFKEEGDHALHLAFLKTVRDAHNNGTGPVYVHCKTGSDRVGLAVAIYRVVECGWDAPTALGELRRHQPYWMAVFFNRYPTILRDAEARRADWLTELDEMSTPAVQRSAVAATPGCCP
jgi:protein-tyrosine phosphatase